MGGADSAFGADAGDACLCVGVTTDDAAADAAAAAVGKAHGCPDEHLTRQTRCCSALRETRSRTCCSWKRETAENPRWPSFWRPDLPRTPGTLEGAG